MVEDSKFAVSYGELLVDMAATPSERQLTVEGFFGGAPANTAVGLAKLDVPASFIGQVGNDVFGKFLKGFLDAHHVDTSQLILTEDHPTTLAVVSIEPSGARDFAFYPGAHDKLSPQSVHFPQGARLLHFGSLLQIADGADAATAKLIDQARLVALDRLSLTHAQRAENLDEVKTKEHDLEVELFGPIISQVTPALAQKAVNTSFLQNDQLLTPQKFINYPSRKFFNWRWLQHVAPEWAQANMRGVYDTTNINSPVMWTSLLNGVETTGTEPSAVTNLTKFYGRDRSYAARAASGAQAQFLELSTLYLGLAALFGADFSSHIGPAKRHSVSYSHSAGVAAGDYFGSKAASFDGFLERMQSLFPVQNGGCPITKHPGTAIGFLARNTAFIGGWRNGSKAVCQGIGMAATLYGAYGNLLRNDDYINLIS